MSKHHGVLTYYNSDDGVWLVCSEQEHSTLPMCWETKLTDYFGSLKEANELWAAHLAEAHPSEEDDRD
jgi:hypothetical protein